MTYNVLSGMLSLYTTTTATTIVTSSQSLQPTVTLIFSHEMSLTSIFFCTFHSFNEILITSRLSC